MKLTRSSLLVLLLLLPAVAIASGKHHNVGADSNSSAVVTNDSLGIGVSGADMVINDGYRTYSVMFGLWQDTKVNPLVLARDLAVEGNYHAAAILRCTPKAVSKAFGGRDSCIEVLSVPPVLDVPTAVPVEHIEDEEEFHEEQQMLYADLEAKLKNLEDEQAQEKRRRQAAIRQAQEREQQKQQYAQELLEELEEWK